MSRKKERKLRKIRNKGIAHRIIITLLAEFAFITVCIFTGFLFFINLVNSYILTSDKDMKKIVSIVNENWDNKTLLSEKITTLMSVDESFESVVFVDDDFKTLIKFGESDFEINYKDFNDYSIGMFPKTGILREYISEIDEDVKIDSFFTKLPKTFIFQELSINKKMLKWANGKMCSIGQWIIYKTDFDSVNVAVNYQYVVSNFYANLIVFVAAVLAILIGLSVIYKIISTLSIIHGRKNISQIIYTDLVTGGHNKEYFLNYALRGISKKQLYAVVQFRLEKYRNYCTAYGLKQGENLLESIYCNASEFIKKREILAHIEKSDFAMLLKYESNEQLEKRLKTMMDAFNEKCKSQHLIFSAGICAVKSKNDDITFLLTAAGLALSKAEKQSVKAVWFNDEMKESQVWERRIEDDMENAITNREFQVYLQPKYSTKKEELAAAEALVRWIHPVLGFISPGKFIPIFEKNGFIIQLDDYMLTEISKLQAGWLSEGKKLVPISVNVSRAHFTCNDLAEHICSIVDEYKVPHKFIELELTESAFFDDKSTLLSTVKKLKEYGFKVSMDDFGAGYSSLNSLKELPLDIIKLDAEFFRGIDDINRANTIVGDTIALAKKLGMEIVAEGIETREQVDFLAKQDCDLIQGFYFAKPLPVNEFVERAYGKHTEIL